MSDQDDNGSFDARPDGGIFKVIKHLKYKAQYAFAEYIDNSISSYEENKAALLALDPNYKLRVDIEIGDGQIIVRDNAGGIPRDQYARAFKTAEPPADPKKGLNEFGMGMKTASIWLSNYWIVNSTAIGEEKTGTVVFDVDRMINSKSTILKPTWSAKQHAKQHGTTIILQKLNRSITALPSIKKHLAEIYRCYLRTRDVEIRVYRTEENESDPNCIVRFEELSPLVSVASYPNGPKEQTTWKKPIEINLPGGLKVTGSAMVLDKGNTAMAGLYLFRRNRLIIGASEPYRPSEIFGRANSFPSQRVYGELHLDGYEVTHTKDDIIWGSKGDDEETFIKEVKLAMTGGGMNLIMQALNHRAKILEDNDTLPQTVEDQNTRLEEEISTKKNELQTVVAVQDESSESAEEPHLEEPKGPKKLKSTFEPEKIGAKSFTIQLPEESWVFHIKVEKGGADDALFTTFTSRDNDKEGMRKMTSHVVINANNKFGRNYLNRDDEFYEVILRFAVASSFAKARCDNAGVKYTNSFLRYMNESLTLLDGSTKNA